MAETVNMTTLFGPSQALLRRPTNAECERVAREKYLIERHGGTETSDPADSSAIDRNATRLQYDALSDRYPAMLALASARVLAENIGSPLNCSAIDTYGM